MTERWQKSFSAQYIVSIIQMCHRYRFLHIRNFFESVRFQIGKCKRPAVPKAGISRPFVVISLLFNFYAAFFLIRRLTMMSVATAKISIRSASTWDTGIWVPGMKRVSVRMPSMTNLPSPYPPKYSRHISPWNRLCFRKQRSAASTNRFHRLS